MVLQVHDELLFQGPQEMKKTPIVPIVEDAMENVIQLTVPIEADLSFGHNWRDMQ